MTEANLLELLAAAKLHSTADGALQNDPLKFLALFASLVEDRCNRANHLCEVLSSISLGAQNSATSKEDLGKQARAALERHVSTQQPKQSKVLTPAEIEEIGGPDFLKNFVDSLEAEDLIPASHRGIWVTEYCVDNEPSEAVGLRIDPESRIGQPLFFLIEQGARDDIAVTLTCLQGLVSAAISLEKQRAIPNSKSSAESERVIAPDISLLYFLDQLELSPRLRNSLITELSSRGNTAGAGRITTPSEFLELSSEELLRWPNIGRRALHELEDKLRKNGLYLRKEV